MSRSFAPDSSPAPSQPEAESLGDSEINDTLPVSASYFSNNRMQGDFDAKDIQIPRLELAHGVGPLSEHFQPGHLVFNKSHSLGNGPVELTLLGLRKRFLEDTEYGSEVFPRNFDSLEEARAAGLKLVSERPRGEKYGVASYVMPVLDVHALIAIPAGHVAEAEAFHNFGGKNYVEASWTLRKIAYTRVAKLFITASTLALRRGLYLRPWLISTKREKFGANFVWVPGAVIQAPHSAEQVSWIENEVLQVTA